MQNMIVVQFRNRPEKTYAYDQGVGPQPIRTFMYDQGGGSQANPYVKITYAFTPDFTAVGRKKIGFWHMKYKFSM